MTACIILCCIHVLLLYYKGQSLCSHYFYICMWFEYIKYAEMVTVLIVATNKNECKPNTHMHTTQITDCRPSHSVVASHTPFRVDEFEVFFFLFAKIKQHIHPNQTKHTNHNVGDVGRSIEFIVYICYYAIYICYVLGVQTPTGSFTTNIFLWCLYTHTFCPYFIPICVVIFLREIQKESNHLQWVTIVTEHAWLFHKPQFIKNKCLRNISYARMIQNKHLLIPKKLSKYLRHFVYYKNMLDLIISPKVWCFIICIR